VCDLAERDLPIGHTADADRAIGEFQVLGCSFEFVGSDLQELPFGILSCRLHRESDRVGDLASSAHPRVGSTVGRQELDPDPLDWLFQHFCRDHGENRMRAGNVDGTERDGEGAVVIQPNVRCTGFDTARPSTDRDAPAFVGAALA